MLSVHSFSEVGGHRVNEDAFCVQAHPVDSECWLSFLADGQGGQLGGGPAAQLACRTALAAAVACRPKSLIKTSVWPGILRQADKAVEADDDAGYTTLVGLCVFRNCIVGASSGDSAVLLVCGDKPYELSAGQHKNPPVGSGAAVVAPFATLVKEPWLLLAMSDGVWKYVGLDRVIEIARRERGQAVMAQLQNEARLAGGGRFQDDFTLVLFEATAPGDEQR